MTVNDEIRNKLQFLDRRCAELRERAGLSLEEFVRNRDRVLATEHLTHIAVECAVDTCQLALELADRIPPGSAPRTVEEARTVGIISNETWAMLDTYIEVRNELVHDYETMVDEKTHADARQLVDNLPDFIREVAQFVELRERGG